MIKYLLTLLLSFLCGPEEPNIPIFHGRFISRGEYIPDTSEGNLSLCLLPEMRDKEINLLRSLDGNWSIISYRFSPILVYSINVSSTNDCIGAWYSVTRDFSREDDMLSVRGTQIHLHPTHRVTYFTSSIKMKDITNNERMIHVSIYERPLWPL
jgi:hypothetical protein